MSQSLVVSEYLQVSGIGGVASEWTEILTIGDNVDMRGIILTDNNGSRTVRQGGVRFADHPLWRHVRSGTVIIIRHRGASAIDTDGRDGFIDIGAEHPDYFEPWLEDPNNNWVVVAMAIGAAGDILELLGSGLTHMHSLSHGNPADAYFVQMAHPKPNHPQSILTHTSIAVVGHGIGAYQSVSAPLSSHTHSQGLPNQMHMADNENTRYWRELREPGWPLNPALVVSANANFDTTTLAWDHAINSYPLDSVQGYLVLRNTTDEFSAPQDGRTYAPGEKLGSATVVANVVQNNGAAQSYRDALGQNDLPDCGANLYYRVYAYRYHTDNVQPNGFHMARGRAYNSFEQLSANVLRTSAPQVSISAPEVIELCSGDSFELRAIPEGFAYQWYRDAMPIAEATNDSLLVSSAGMYTVRLTAPNSCTDISAGVEVIVLERPEARIAEVDDQCLHNNTFAFTHIGTPNVDIYDWDFGQDALPPTSAAAHPTDVIYTTPGMKTVELFVIKNGCRSELVATEEFMVFTDPTIEAGPDTAICKGASIQLQGSGNGAYLWEPTGSLSDPTIAAPIAAPRSTTIYTLSVTDELTGCTVQDSVEIAVHSNPEARVSIDGDSEICRGASAMLTAFPHGNEYEYLWLPSGTRSRNLRVDRTASYRVIVTDRLTGCSDTSAPVGVIVQDPPEAVIIPSGSTDICPGQDVILTALQRDGYLYKWNTGAETPVITVSQPGDYQLTVTNEFGCKAVSDPIRIRYRNNDFQLLTNTLIFPPLNECQSSFTMFTAITNTGEEALTITSATLPGFSIISPTLPATIGPGASTAVMVRFSAANPGQYDGELEFTGNPCAITRTLKVSALKIRSENSGIRFDRFALDFGAIPECKPGPYIDSFVVSNNGAKPISLPLMPQIPHSFALVHPLDVSFPLSIAQGDSLTFVIEFRPHAFGVFNENFALQYVENECRVEQFIALSGLYAHVELSITPETQTVDFGPLTDCEQSSETTITVTNSGTVELTGLDADINNPDFIILTPLPHRLASGAQAQLLIQYKPGGVGFSDAVLTVTARECALREDIMLHGEKSGLSFSAPGSYRFDTLTAPCGPELASTATLELIFNGGPDANGIIESAFFLNGTSIFDADIEPQSILLGGQPFAFTVNFSPTGDGNFHDTLALVVSPCNTILKIALSGTRQTAEISAAQQTLDFLTLPVGQAQTGSLRFINGDVPVTITAVEGLTDPFGFVSSSNPIPGRLAPHEILDIVIRYTATATTTASTFVRLKTNEPCRIISDSVAVFGKGSADTTTHTGNDTIRVTIGLPKESYGIIGEITTIPVTLAGHGLDALEVTDMSLRFDYNGAILAPQGIRPGPRISLSDIGMRESPSGTLEVFSSNATLSFAATDTLFYLDFTSLLGSTTATSIALDHGASEITATSAVVVIESEAGDVILSHSCAVDTRLVSVGGAAQLMLASPHPVVDILELQVQTISDEPTSLILYDRFGRNVVALIDATLPIGTYAATHPTTSLANGVYFAVLRTGVVMRILPIVIAH